MPSAFRWSYFETTYQELKHSKYKAIQSTDAKFWDYLSGIETDLNGKKNWRDRDFETTYQELKLLLRFAIAFLLFILRLPIRNWNLQLAGRLPKSEKILRLPIRNWNNGILVQDSGNYIHFETTYQELKLLQFCYPNYTPKIFWDYLSGIETFLRLIYLRFPFVNFETTYQELKHTRLSIIAVDCAIFWDYLSGIETDMFTEKAHILGAILRLPIRNWNKLSNLLKFRKVKILRLPIRNWNKSGA